MNYTIEEIDLKIIEVKAEIFRIYDNKPENKDLQEIDNKIILTFMDKFESLILIKNLMQSK